MREQVQRAVFGVKSPKSFCCRVIPSLFRSSLNMIKSAALNMRAAECFSSLGQKSFLLFLVAAFSDSDHVDQNAEACFGNNVCNGVTNLNDNV